MAGRKRKFGVPRRPDGKIKSSHHEKQKRETACDVVLDQRRRHFGAVGAEDKRNGKGHSHANDRRYGYALGRLLIAGKIDQKQHDAGQDFSELFAAFRRVADMPPAVVAAISYVPRTGGMARDLEDDEAAAISRRYSKVCEAIKVAGMGTFSALYDVVVRDLDPEDPAKVALALQAVVNHFCRRRRSKPHKRSSLTNKVVVSV
ncbi:hypothetical protein [Mesorhizobium sp. Cs1299R1N3]|uniref:hypothetical protein n=1 Tax=Mesorhizobium sp. Cs1299R1N3 TaxID=3015173 RepID=UPI00301E3232